MYKAWGEIQALAVSEVEQNLRFQGQYFDDETGLHYNTFRYYDPKMAWFITQDPIGLSGGSNLYQYAENPICWIHPWGWSAKPSNSPDASRWLEKGGSVHSEIKARNRVYDDWEGNRVRYPNGHPHFTPYKRQQVEVSDLKGNPGKSRGGDFGKADALAPKGPADYPKNTWHHHEKYQDDARVPKKFHNRFTHSGRVKISNRHVRLGADMPVVYKKGLTASDMAQIEQELNRSLPAEYGDLLKKMNGFFITAPDYVQIPLRSVDEGVISFDRLFGWLPQEECNDVVAFNNEFIDELSFLNNVIAIGEDGGGNPYVIIFNSKKDGVYYWDRTHLHEGDSKKKCGYPGEERQRKPLFYLVKSSGVRKDDC